MPDIPSAHLLLGRRPDAAPAGPFRSKITLLLHHHYDAIADPRGLLAFEQLDAFDDCGARVIDAVEESLG